MANKTKKTQAETPDEPHGRDLFQTPKYAVELLIPFIPKSITHVWECAAGERKISMILEEHGYIVHSSDIRTDLENITLENFLTDFKRTDVYRNPYAIITNPPFSLKRKFYKRCLEYNLPFALLIPADYCGWIIDAISNGAERIIPTRRIDYITPSGLSGATGHTSDFHSMWLTKGFGLGKLETFVELTKEMKENI